MQHDDFLKRILTAKVYGAAVETALDKAEIMSARLGNTLLLKREDQQRTNSFKMRGAFNKISQLDEAALARGVITASSGNHAQGVAYGARVKGCRAVIVMPLSAPAIKIDAVRALGGEVVSHGADFQGALDHALAMGEREGMTFVHPYDDPDVVAGQGTIGMEILRQHQDPIHAVFVAVGGGGMIAGIAAYIKALSPQIRIIAVHAEGSDSMMRSVEAGKPVRLDRISVFADGVSVNQVGDVPFAVAKDLIDEFMVIGVDAMCTAMREMFAENRAMLEPSAALTVAAAKDYVAREGIRDQTLVAVLCGSNLNFDRLGFVVERSYVGEHREALLGVDVPRGEGSLAKLIDAVGARRFSELSYRVCDGAAGQVFMGVYVSGPDDTAATIAALEGAGFGTTDLSGNELAKAHLRHSIGGRPAAPAAGQELLFRVTFPETPGNFRSFLEGLPTESTVTAFHYRNHGQDQASVLIGFAAPPGGANAVRARLAALGLGVIEETDNPAAALFLREGDA